VARIRERCGCRSPRAWHQSCSCRTSARGTHSRLPTATRAPRASVHGVQRARISPVPASVRAFGVAHIFRRGGASTSGSSERALVRRETPAASSLPLHRSRAGTSPTLPHVITVRDHRLQRLRVHCGLRVGETRVGAHFFFTWRGPSASSRQMYIQPSRPLPLGWKALPRSHKRGWVVVQLLAADVYAPGTIRARVLVSQFRYPQKCPMPLMTPPATERITRAA